MLLDQPFIEMAHRVAPVIQIQTSERQTTKLEMRMSKNVSTLLLTIATFNVLGLSSFEKRYSLAKDCFDYNIDILAIQETKCTQSDSRGILGKHVGNVRKRQISSGSGQ